MSTNQSKHRVYSWGLILGLLLPTQAYSFNPIDLQRLLETGVCQRCDLSNADLQGKTLTNSHLNWSNLSGANLSAANFQGAYLVGANLQDAIVDEANLQASVLREANLRGVDLTSVRLAGSDLRRADMQHLDVDLDLEWIELTGVLLEGAVFKGGRRCAGFSMKGGWGCAAE